MIIPAISTPTLIARRNNPGAIKPTILLTTATPMPLTKRMKIIRASMNVPKDLPTDRILEFSFDICITFFSEEKLESI